MSDDVIAKIEALHDDPIRFGTPTDAYRNAIRAVLAILRAEPSRSSPDPDLQHRFDDVIRRLDEPKMGNPKYGMDRRAIEGELRQITREALAALGSSPDLTGLDRLPSATCYRTHTQPDEGKGVFGAVWLADVKRALRSAAPTGATPDPHGEDLRDILHTNFCPIDVGHAAGDICWRIADRIAARYAAPTGASPETLRLYGLDIQQIKKAIDVADYWQPQWREKSTKPDENCFSLPDGTCIGVDCIHDVRET